MHKGSGQATLVLLAAPGIICLPLALAGLDESSPLAYNRSAILDAGQYWRLLTAHLVHTDLVHTLLNLAVWPLILWLARDRLSICQWSISFLICAIGIDLGLYGFAPAVEWYVGLSGILHGLLVIAALAAWRHEPALARLLLLGITAKLLWEQNNGALPGSDIIGHPIIVDAHLFGALSGALCACGALVGRKRLK